MILKNSENNGTEEIGLVTPTPGGDELQHWFPAGITHGCVVAFEFIVRWYGVIVAQGPDSI